MKHYVIAQCVCDSCPDYGLVIANESKENCINALIEMYDLNEFETSLLIRDSWLQISDNGDFLSIRKCNCKNMEYHNE